MDGKKTDNKSRPVSPINGQPIPNGRPKGVPNKVTTQFKEALVNLFDFAAPEMIEWLKDIDNPKDRFDILAKFGDYIFPKLARQELQNLDKNGDPADPVKQIEIILVDPKDKSS